MGENLNIDHLWLTNEETIKIPPKNKPKPFKTQFQAAGLPHYDCHSLHQNQEQLCSKLHCTDVSSVPKKGENSKSLAVLSP